MSRQCRPPPAGQQLEPVIETGGEFFDAKGGKLSDDVETQIEEYLDQLPRTRASVELGRALRVDKSRVRYQEFCASTVSGLDLSGFKIVIDCANGAGYKVGPIQPKFMEGVHTLAVPSFKNDTLEPRVEVALATAIIKQIQQDGKTDG